jgi:hypothetical protein
MYRSLMIYVICKSVLCSRLPFSLIFQDDRYLILELNSPFFTLCELMFNTEFVYESGSYNYII